jgi:methionine synthase I (cobalamin-dependent)
MAGLPNSMGSYVEDSEMFSVGCLDYAKDDWIDPAGGCCGTFPSYQGTGEDISRPGAGEDLS